MASDECSGHLVLIVEDNPANLMLMRAVLQRANFRTAEASSAEEALARLAAARPDAILMDIQLPGEDGLALTRRLKSDPGTAAIPVIALTAHAMKEDRERALAAGCDEYFPKPIDTRTFAPALAAVLRARGRAEGG